MKSGTEKMDRASHLSVVVDLSPTHWYSSSTPSQQNPRPLSLKSFLSQLLVFLNSHIACKDENTLAVFGVLPGRRYVHIPMKRALSGMCHY